MKPLIKTLLILFASVGSAQAQLPSACTKTGATYECLGLQTGALERIIIQSSIKGEALPAYIREFLSYKIVQGDQAIIELLDKNSNITVCCQFSCDNANTCSQANLPRQSCSAIAGRAINSSFCDK